MKIHALHVVYQPWVFDIVYKAFQPFITGAMKNCVFFHGDNMESLHKHIDPKHLPQKQVFHFFVIKFFFTLFPPFRYGGRHPDYSFRPWILEFSKTPRILEELKTLGYEIEETEYEEYKSDSEKSVNSVD